MNDYYFFDDSLSFLADNYPEYFKLEKKPDMNMTDTKICDLLKNQYPDLIDLTKTTSEHDFYIPSKKIGGDIKCRMKHYEDTLGIDLKKYKYLLENNFNYYIVWTPGNRTLKNINKGEYFPKLYVWDLRKVEEPEWLNRLSPTSTQYKHHQLLDEQMKHHGKLRIEDAKDITHLLY